MHVVIKFSRLFLAILIVLHILAIISIVILPWSWWVRLVLVLGVMAQFCFMVSRFVLLAHSNSVAQVFYQNDCWFLQNNVGDKYQVDFENGYVSKFLILLNFKRTGKWRVSSVVVFKDGVENQDMWRKLRVRLFSLGNA
ncbi:MAG: hypothetical protein JXR42_01730 [Gammaproteobacteria bacterium]|nr:hypothetical protein [Gammaproteobacteria bacterium]